MASDVNAYFVTGRFTKDPELKSTNSGTYFCRFSLASNYWRKQGDGGSEQANFFDCIAWGKLAENIHKYFVKGQKIHISGELRWSSWEGQDGKKHSKIELQVQSFQFMGKKGEGSQNNSDQSTTPDPAAAATFGGGDDDIPF